MRFPSAVSQAAGRLCFFFDFVYIVMSGDHVVLICTCEGQSLRVLRHVYRISGACVGTPKGGLPAFVRLDGRAAGACVCVELYVVFNGMRVHIDLQTDYLYADPILNLDVATDVPGGLEMSWARVRIHAFAHTVTLAHCTSPHTHTISYSLLHTDIWGTVGLRRA